VVIELRDRDGWVFAACRCGNMAVIVSGDDEHPVAAIDVAVGIDELANHARACEAAKSSTDRLLDKLMSERYGLTEGTANWASKSST
jgi:hypothetical protein